MRLETRRAVIGDEEVLRDLRMQALTDAPEAFGSTLERELARTTEDWQKWFAPGMTMLLLAEGEPRGLEEGQLLVRGRRPGHGRGGRGGGGGGEGGGGAVGFGVVVVVVVGGGVFDVGGGDFQARVS